MSECGVHRVPLSVEAVFLTDGRLRPRFVIFDGARYEIERILSVATRRPTGIACIAPTEYRVTICGTEKKFYYENETGVWFSVMDTTVLLWI